MPKVVPGVVLDARDEAKRIVELAEQRAHALLAEAEATADRMHREAVERGHAEGLEQAAAILAQAEAARDEALSREREVIVELALSVAAKIVEAELETRPEQADAILRGLLERMRRARHITVHVHPRDAARIADLLEEHMTAVPDPALARGEFRIESEQGELDARFETRLRLLRELLASDLP